jgi:hypothetical protein
VPLSDGQHLWREMIERLEAEGVTMGASKPVFFDQSQGRSLHVEGGLLKKLLSGDRYTAQVKHILSTKP